MPLKDRAAYNKYQREYRRKRRQEDQDFLRKELERSREYSKLPWVKEKKAKKLAWKTKRRKHSLNIYKVTQGCSKCKARLPACCFDFHHVDGKDKDFHIAQVAGGVSLKRLFEELRKCIVVCANCHRKIHGGYYG